MIHKATNTLDWVLIAKGIGILLVVIGHFNPESSPAYWTNTRNVIYSFHMPLFFLLSGYLYTHGKYTYQQLLTNKIKRLIYPFVSIALLFFTIKYIAGELVYLGHPIDNKSLYYLLTDPVHSYMPLLWFVYALFIIFAIYPLLRLLLPNIIILCTLLVCIIYFGTDIPILGKSIFNMPFFIVGILLHENNRTNCTLLNTRFRNIFSTTIIFIIFYSVRIQYESIYIPDYLFIFILGTSGAIFVINISKVIAMNAPQKLAPTLTLLGFYSMTIYLFHTLFESTIRVIFMQKISFVAIPFEVTAITAIFAGIIFPLELEKRVLRKFLLTRKFLLGIK
jgi:fucose 4-O-acetylase-like acetyltransferase